MIVVCTWVRGMDVCFSLHVSDLHTCGNGNHYDCDARAKMQSANDVYLMKTRKKYGSTVTLSRYQDMGTMMDDSWDCKAIASLTRRGKAVQV